MPVINVKDVELSYQHHPGANSRRGPVVLVCGTGQQTSSWNAFGIVAALTSAGHDVITFENRGMPPSSCPPPPWTTDDMADDVMGLVSELCDQPVHLMGTSLGANIVHTLALRRPDLVKSAAMIIGGTQFVAGYQPLVRGMLELLENHGRIPKGIDTYVNILSILPPAERADPERIKTIEALADTFIDGFGPGGQHGQIAANVSWIDGGGSRITELAAMQIPCLMIANEHDPFFALSDMRQAAATIPDCRLEILTGVAHVPLTHDANTNLNTFTTQFFAEHDQDR